VNLIHFQKDIVLVRNFMSMYNKQIGYGVAGQEHCSIQVAIIAAFFVLRNQVLVPS